MDILGLRVNTGQYQTFVERITDLAFSGTSSYVCVANVHMLVEAYLDKKFAEVVNSADIITPDGVPLLWASRLLYGKKQDRVAGMDLLPDLLKRAERESLPVYFYGGTTEMLDNAQIFLAQNYPRLNVAGLFSPPFRSLTDAEQAAIEQNINNSKARIVFVILGCPKQEKWMGSMKGKINACMIGIGGALPVLIGAQKRAPQWMQKNGLEWLYRLSQEPRRLAKRYIITNSIFTWLLLKTWIKQLFTTKTAGNTL
ncbi:MAG: WecB/TagA/CpsF family glycosyltransferase [Agriterribacter sp.]